MVFEERLRQVRRPNVYWVSSVANQPIHAARFVPTRRRSARYVAFTALISISNVEANRNRILSWGKVSTHVPTPIAHRERARRA